MIFVPFDYEKNYRPRFRFENRGIMHFGLGRCTNIAWKGWNQGNKNMIRNYPF